MNARIVDLSAGVLVTLAGLFSVFYLIPQHISSGMGFGLSPRAFPYLCAGAVTVLGVALVIFSARDRALAERPAPVSRAALKRLVVVLAVLALVLALMQWVGFLAAAVVAVALLMLLMGERRWLPIVLTSLGWSLFLWVLFDRVLGTPLP
ncbi:tripartite tricarboxylate transporter TctB family protein [Alcanivorax marinus]|uniref:Tripartite tricarboxylate transporter TctB family protein n=1 Tax=Alloalcanivorax marinus TaxID=1177169 RepID=A0A9Q3YKY8_9GAMM|nr:tripartite tricarboxylate transporter TctB family protein [Alloalcanivorax marinus]MBM7332577.1 tripartite tricarboxylate transporter TctB family protein [Alloalcanivorax marinus]MCC4307259.1 tripartite tricarboxylate transporter TctB family protein [Alloalcanivorax marinus]MCU5787278.1 membrane protein TctB [Alloalcanivorax marinus]